VSKFLFAGDQPLQYGPGVAQVLPDGTACGLLAEPGVTYDLTGEPPADGLWRPVKPAKTDPPA
jgi:hypothetical protein